MARELGQALRSIEEVQRTILSVVETVDAEERPLARALSAVLREPIVSRDTIPPFDNSAMDGFAVQAEDLAGATEDGPVALPIAGTIAAGRASDEALTSGQCFRIMTGAPIPDGADAVIPHELVRWDDSAATFVAPPRPRQNIRSAGGDFRPGDEAIAAGTSLRAAHLGIAGTLGYATLRVSRKLRVAVLSPGDELVDVGEPLGPGQIRNSNAYALRGALEDLGADVVSAAIVPDREDAVRGAIEAAVAEGADVILSTGGVSAGDFDYVKSVVESDANPGYVFKVAMRPGKPQVFGRFRDAVLFGLPGNPAASILSFEMLVRPALRKMAGAARLFEPRFGVRFPEDYRYPSGRVFLLRARVVPDDERGEGYLVEPPGAQGSGRMAAFASANAIVVLPADRDVARAGDVFPAQWIGGRP